MARRKYLDEDGLAYFWGKIKTWVNGLLTGKQDTLESGVNIKTVGGESLLGEGDIPIEGGGGGGTSDYEGLYNKPSIGGVELFGDKSAGDLGLQSAISQSNKLSYNMLKDTPSIPTEASVAAWGFVKNTVNNLTNYYLKSETYTKAEVAALIGAIQQFHYEIYPTLPQTGQSNVLYLIGPTGSGSDRYEEYVYANNAFTKIGDTSIDLSGYVTTSALNTALADYTTTANLTTLLAGKQDTISDLSTIRSGASLGATAYQKPNTGIPASDLASGVIPTVPTISTDITADATSDVKTASPKAVKTFVEGKGYGTYSKPSGGIPASDLESGVIPTVPTISTNVVTDKTSDAKTASPKAVYDEIHHAVVSSQPAGGMLPNVMYNLGTLSGNTTFTLATPADANIVNHYYWAFDTPSTAPTITWPQSITAWNGGSAPTINASKHYEISVVDGVACYMETEIPTT